MTILLYQGHGSFRITSQNGYVIYVDPFAGEGYDKPADLILVTHQHYDHNQVDKVTKKDSCQIIQNYDALVDGQYKTFKFNDIEVQAVPAYNENHDPNECVGYIITVDGIKIYAAGDTSTTKEMAKFKDLNLDYALLPIDGIFNMDPVEATSCANIIAPKYAIPYHMKPKYLYDDEMANKFTAKNRLIIKAGEEIYL